MPAAVSQQTGDAPEAKVVGLKEVVQQENAKAANNVVAVPAKAPEIVQAEPKKRKLRRKL